MKKYLSIFIRYGLTVVIASILLTVVVDALESPDGLSLKFWQKGGEALCPDGMVGVVSPDGDFCIDRYEASPGRKCKFQSIDNQSQTMENMDYRDCLPESEADRKPWVFVSKSQAQALCARAGKRLPTAAEWYYAALGTPDIDQGWQEEDCQVDKNWPLQPGLSGYGSECLSGAGAYDMIGNVWEWIEETAVDGRISDRELPPQGYVASIDGRGNPLATQDTPLKEMENDHMWLKRSGARQVARGGYYDNAEEAGVNAWYIVNESIFSGIGVGFRCVQ